MLVAEKNLAEGNFQRPLEKEHSHGDRHAQSQSRSDPNGQAFRGKFHGAQNQREFGAFADHHQENKCGQANPRGKFGFRRVVFDALLDLLFQVPRDVVHPHDHGDHKNGRDQKHHPFKSVFADLPALQRDGHGQAGNHRRNDASPHPAHQIRAPGAIQIDQYDADDQGGFDTFT